MPRVWVNDIPSILLPIDVLIETTVSAVLRLLNIKKKKKTGDTTNQSSDMFLIDFLTEYITTTWYQVYPNETDSLHTSRDRLYIPTI